MQVLVDLKTHLLNSAPPGPDIVQVDPAPVPQDGVAINGKYLLPTLPGLTFPITSSDYILPINGGDVSSKSFAHLLATYSGMFDNIYFNPLLTAVNVADIDLTAVFKDTTPPTFAPPNSPAYFPTRCQVGRYSGPLPTGTMPTHTVVLQQNTTVTPNNPGVMITQEIDISGHTGPAGTDEFLVYRQLYSFATSDDVETTQNGGKNTPAIRTYTDTDQEPTGFSVYLSPDNGDHWCEVGLAEPIAFQNKTTKFRLAFVNRSSTKVYVASFAVLF